MGKVLIIDDEKQILGLLSRIIGLEGYDVFQASTCRAGLKQLEQHTPEVILCDVCLPDGSGVELVRELKKLRPRRRASHQERCFRLYHQRRRQQ